MLLGDDAMAILAAATEAPVVDVRTSQIRYDPGRSVTATFSVQVGGHDAPLTLTAYAGRMLPSSAAIVSEGASRIAVWRFPDDPELPGLKHATQPELLGTMLAEVGAKHPIRHIRTRSYRARRRAVIEVVTERHRLFVKVVRPSRVKALQEAHTLVADHVRVPRSLGYSDELGVAVLEAIPGVTMRRAIERDDSDLPPAAGLAALLDRLPSLPGERPGPIDRLAAHQRFLSTVLPDASDLLNEIVETIGHPPSEPRAPAHNDFHSAQVIVADGTVSGLVDIDTVGIGCRADDYAMLLGHIHTLALTSGRSRSFADYGARLLSVFEREVGRTSLRPRIAATMTAFATAPFRSQQADWQLATVRRLNAAREWLEHVD